MAQPLPISAPPFVGGEIARECGRRTRVVIVGAGVMGRRHARVVSALGHRLELAGVMDVDAATAREAAGAWGAPVFASELEAVAKADAVFVATPIGAHAQTVRAALMAGRDVLVEKPVAASASEAFALVALARDVGARLFVGHSERFNPVVRALRSLVAPGDIRAIELRRTSSRTQAGQSHGALMNLGVHDLDLAAYLTASPIALRHAVGRIGESAREVSADVIVGTASGATVHVHVDATARQRVRTIALTTPTHVFVGEMLASTLVRIDRRTGERLIMELPDQEPLAAQALAFADAVSGFPSPEIARGIDGARALQTAERAAQAIVSRSLV